MNPAIGCHPIIGYRLNQDHMADLRHQAQRTALARAARQTRRARRHQAGRPGPSLPALARPALAVPVSTNQSIAPAGRTKLLGDPNV
jgi:hypothetical protein